MIVARNKSDSHLNPQGALGRGDCHSSLKSLSLAELINAHALVGITYNAAGGYELKDIQACVGSPR
jgi:hypothetical protein